MSPEQARGQELDARTDLFSFGAVLYEMATGRQAFSGATSAVTFHAILERAPMSPVRLNPEVPAELERIINKALEKDRAMRYQSAAELRADLKRLKRDTDSARTTAAAAVPTAAGPAWFPRRRWGAMAVAALGGMALLAAAWHFLARTATKPAQPAAINATFTQITDEPGEELFPSLSPDGKSLLYASRAAGNWDIYVRRVGGKNPMNLTKDSPADDTQPAFSPDGDQIAFRSEREGGGIFVMGATGESVRRLTDVGYNPAWSPDGKEIVCAREGVVANPARRAIAKSELWRVSVANGEKRLVTAGDAVQPHWSPHGYRIAYWANKAGQRDIWTIPASGGAPLPVTDDVALDWNPVWSPDGNHLYFLSDRSGSMNLWRVPIEEKTGKVLGPPEPLTTPATDTAHLSISRDGRRIAYVQRVASLNIHKVGFDPAAGTVTGQSVAVTRGSRLAGIPDVSPDGEWLTFYSWGKPADIFIIRTDGTGLRQLTEDIYRDLRPRWSPDGKRIAFYSNRSGRFEIWVINRDGSGLQQLTHNSLEAAVCPVWSPDGTQLAYTLYSGEAFVLDVAKAGTPQASRALPHLPDPGQRFQPRSWSGDGQRLAGDCVRPDGSFAGIAIYSFASQQYERLTDFGFSPVWLKDGRRLMFAHENKLFLVGSQTRKVRELFSAALGSDMAATLSPDNRTVYFSFASVEADIWLATLQ